MDAEPGDDLLLRAAELRDRVCDDPMEHGDASEVLLAEARQAFHRQRRATRVAEPLVLALTARSGFEQARMEHARARHLLNEAARIARKYQLDERIRDVLLTRGAVNLELGRFAAARRDIDAAAAVSGSAPPAVDLNQASLLYNVGRLADAAALCRRVLRDPAAPTELRAKVGNNLALIEAQRGRPDVALGHLDEAKRLAGPALSAAISSSRGWVLAQAGRLAESLAEFDEAERLHVRSGLPLGELLLEQFDAMVDLRLLPEARALAERAGADFTAHGLGLMAGEARLRMAHVALFSGDLAVALQMARDVAVDFRRQRRTAWTARATALAVHATSHADALTEADVTAARRSAAVLERLGLRSAAVDAHLVAGRVALEWGRTRAGLGHLSSAESLAVRGSLLVRLRGRLASVLAAQARGDDGETLRHSRAGLADLSRHRGALGSMELRALASGHGMELGQIGLQVLLRTGSPASVLSWMDQTRAAALLTVAPPAGPEVLAQRAALSAVQAELENERRASRPEPALLLARQAALESEIRRVTWASSSEHDPDARPVSIAAARRLLGRGALVCFGSSRSELFAIVLTARRARLEPLGPVAEVQAEADAVLFALRRLTRSGPHRSLQAARASAEHGLVRLRELLLGPLGIDPAAPIVILPAGATRHVPWSALHAMPVTVAPSLSLWARSARTTPPADKGTVLVAGPELPGAVGEVEQLAHVHEGATVLAPPRSTVPAVTAALADADLAHLACHGLLRRDNPTFSALQLSGGNLSLHELDQLGSAPRRVVLAACDSATGVGYEGDEVLGFVGALMSRGTQGVVASVAPVGDLESLELTGALHAGLRGGMSMADALHGARSAVDTAEPRAFVNWCATTAFGSG